MTESVKQSVLIVEDEFPARKLLVNYVHSRPELKLAAVAKNGQEALAALAGCGYDLVLLDIHLPDISGIDVLEKIDKLPYIIFTSAYDKYAVRAFELGALDYLLKPISQERFNQAIDRFLAARKRPPDFDSFKNLVFSFKAHRNQYLIPYADIVYFSSHGKTTIVHTLEKELETGLLLKSIEVQLPSEVFLRIHKQFIVNRNYISHLQYNFGGQYHLFLKNEEADTLPVGRQYVPVLKQNNVRDINQ